QSREDLYYRRNVFQIHLPPLRDRKEDIPPVTEFLLGELNHKHNCKVSDVSPDVLEAFQLHNWPGNVRELRNVLERAVILTGEGTIDVAHLPAFLQNRDGAPADAHSAPSPALIQTPPASDGLAAVRFQIGTTVEEAEKVLILRT